MNIRWRWKIGSRIYKRPWHQQKPARWLTFRRGKKALFMFTEKLIQTSEKQIEIFSWYGHNHLNLIIQNSFFSIGDWMFVKNFYAWLLYGLLYGAWQNSACQRPMTTLFQWITWAIFLQAVNCVFTVDKINYAAPAELRNASNNSRECVDERSEIFLRSTC